jgi:uncharacterized protein (TIGR03000 family)
MVRRFFKLFVALLALAAALGLNPALAVAQHHGGGGHGGGHSGGGERGGSWHGGSWHDGGGYGGGWYGGGWYGGYPRYYGGYYPYGYQRYYPWDDGGYRSYYYAPNDDYGTPSENGAYSTPSEEESGRTMPPAAATDNAAHIRVLVPAGAKITFEGKPTEQTGSVRYFNSPPLEPGKSFSYEVKASWREGDREVTKTREVPVHAGDAVTVNFMQPAANTAARAPSP